VLADIELGALYEIPGDGNDRFFARPDAFLHREGVVRLVIEAPPRWCGFWAFCAPEHLSLVAEQEVPQQIDRPTIRIGRIPSTET